jgi:Peptidase M50B-like
VQAGFAYLAAWFLLLGGMRPALELTRARRRGSRARLSDADQLARLTGVSRGAWITLFLIICAAALALGARLLIP